MRRVAKFEKVSYEQFKSGMVDAFSLDIYGIDKDTTEELLKKLYDEIQLPTRSTKFSAGFDFKSPIDITLPPNRTIKIPTGIRVKMNEDYVLMLFPRSSLGFKYRLRFDNTVPIIDADYYYSDNEGHIFAKITNETLDNKTIKISIGDGFMQGIFLKYGITEDDDVNNERNGGIGSTGK